MSYVLMLWTVVAMAGDRHGRHEARDWRAVAEFETAALCEAAAGSLSVGDRYRCVRKR